MTALALIATEGAAWIASDGAAYTDDGVLRLIAQKVVLCPDWECVITGRGAGRSAELFRQQADMAGVRDFDDLLDRAPTLMRETDAASLCRAVGAFHHFTIVLCGYSRTRRQFEIHNIRTRRGQGWDLKDGHVIEVEAFTLCQLPALAMFPIPQYDTAASVGIVVPGGPLPFTTVGNPEAYVQSAVLACRFDAGHRDGGPVEDTHFSCGGFIQLTRLHAVPSPAPERHPGASELVVVMDTQITHRWPDQIGERIDPTRGSLPWWVLPPLPSPGEVPQADQQDVPSEAAE